MDKNKQIWLNTFKQSEQINLESNNTLLNCLVFVAFIALIFLSVFTILNI